MRSVFLATECDFEMWDENSFSQEVIFTLLYGNCPYEADRERIGQIHQAGFCLFFSWRTKTSGNLESKIRNLW